LNEPIFAQSPNWSGIAPVATYVGGKLVFEVK
jgi:hypothetical protein